ncbi:MAG: penicillin-binding protein activator LpoB [Gemmatimonadota bacterium]|nr:penicillin-binding protein activator LpoB [Gemmatimonadota bacterium]
MRFSLSVRVLLLGVAAVSAAGCSIKRVSRIDPAAVTDLSGNWNDVDSRLVASELINQSLAAPWARQYADAHGGVAPTVIIGDMRNRTYEHVAVGTFVKDLERAYVNSGVVRIVASREERAGVREERVDQQTNAAPESRARMAREQGAQFMLQGELNEIVDGAGREQVRFYQIDASLIDLESNAKVWVGQHKIKKYVQRRRLTP